MRSPFIHHLFPRYRAPRPFFGKVHARVRQSSDGLGSIGRRGRLGWARLGSVTWQSHLFDMDRQRIAGLGLEPVLTTSELAEYLGVHVQAIYDLRTDGRGPAGIRVGREIRFRVSDVLRWLDALHEPDRTPAASLDER
jgi:excisionase family DNA binding protein